MSPKQGFSENSKVQQTVVCAVVKRDQEAGTQIAVIQSNLDNQAVFTLPSITGDPRTGAHMGTAKAVLNMFGAQDIVPVPHPSRQGDMNTYMNLIAEVGSDVDTPEHYKWIPLTGAYDLLREPYMKSAAIQLCARYEVPLTETTAQKVQCTNTLK